MEHEIQIDTDIVVTQLSRQIGDLVVQLAVKDAQIEALRAQLQVRNDASH